MPTEKKPSHITVWLAASAISIAFCSAAALLDGPDEIESARLDALSLQDAKRSASIEYRREVIASRACAQLKGPGATYQWTQDGDFICVR